MEKRSTSTVARRTVKRALQCCQLCASLHGLLYLWGHMLATHTNK